MSKIEFAIRLLTALICIGPVVVNCGVVMYDASIVTEECIQNKPIESNYTPQGDIFLLGDLPIYESVNKSAPPPRLIIAVYDIFGWSNDNLKQVTDNLAEANGGFRVILPDFYRGRAWDSNNFPPQDPQELQNWLQLVGNWETTVKPDLMNIVEYYRSEKGIQEFAIFGMCWGGKVTTLAATELENYFNAAAIVHPSSLTNAEAEGIKVPMYLMPTKSEPDMMPFYRILLEKFGGNCGYRRFDDMTHGFAGARGNFSDPVNVARVEEVISTLGKFFNANLPLIQE